MATENLLLKHIEIVLTAIASIVLGVMGVLKLWPKKKETNGTQREMGKMEANIEELLKQNTVLFKKVDDIPRQVADDRRRCPHIEATKELAEAVNNCQQDIVKVKTILDARKTSRD